MSEAEEQLRRVLREHAADAAHLLDEWKEEMLAETRKERGLANARDTRLTHAEEKALRDSLSALREAAGPLVAAIRGYWRKGDGHSLFFGSEKDECPEVMTDVEIEALLAAHDAAPAAPTHATNEHGDCAPWCRACRSNLALGLHPDGSARAAAPTLTLEEVDGAMRKGGVDPATARSVRGILEAKIRVAQKGAGRGDGK